MNVLTPAMGSVSNKNTITSIEGVLIETLDNGKIQISTYDMNKGVRATFEPTSIEREGKFIINAQRLYQTVRVLPDDELTIDINDKLNCEISCGKASFSIFATRGTDFPNLPDLISDRGFEISTETLKKLISKVSHSIAVQDNRAMLMGAFFKINKDKDFGEKLLVFSRGELTITKFCEIFKKFFRAIRKPLGFYSEGRKVVSIQLLKSAQKSMSAFFIFSIRLVTAL